jgi:hypothetical protein
VTVSPTELFTGSVRACWVTTYNLDLGLFDSFLLPRLGDPPLNVVVLADQHKVDKALLAIPHDEAWRLRRTNRRWLLRPMNGGGAFHPKTLLTVTRDRAILLVGSGNLSLNGYERGHETFTEFSSLTPDGRSALTTWLSWMNDLVRATGDRTLTRRFDHLTETLPSLASGSDASPLIHNLREPILDQVRRRLPPQQPTTLHLAAPFHDPNATAVDQLLATLQPKACVIYVAPGHQVDGPALTDVLRRHSQVERQVRQFTTPDGDPVAFVHAKLMAMTYADGTGVVVGGSANLSVAALLSDRASSTYANVELASIAFVTREEAESAFTDEGHLTSRPVDIDSLEGLTADYDDDVPRLPYRLHRASFRPDGSVELSVTPSIPADLLLTDGEATAPAGDARPIHSLIWLVDEAGTLLSNRCVVDVPGELESQLGDRSSTSSDTPAGLNPDDLESPIGGLLLFLHQHIIMDVSESDAVALADRATEGSVDDGDDLWEQLATEKLRRDPRASAYKSILARAGMPNDDLVALLAAMMDRAPDQVREAFSNVLQFPLPDRSDSKGDADDEQDADEPDRDRSWSTTARVRVRLRNVLRRWISALGDDRLTWVDPDAPLGNTIRLADALVWMAVLDLSGEPVGLQAEELLELTRDLLDAAIAVLSPQGDPMPPHTPFRTPELFAAAAILGARHGSGRRVRLLRWQSTLRHAGWLVQPGEVAAHVVSAVSSRPYTPAETATLIEEIANYIDDEEWTRRTVENLHLASLELADHGSYTDIDAAIIVNGIDAPINDPRTVELALAVRAYWHADNIVINDAKGRWRLVLIKDDVIHLREESRPFRSSDTDLSWEDIERMSLTHAPFAGLFRAEDRVA